MGDTLKGVPLTAYRFCRTDDMARLVDAHARCRGPEDTGERPLDLTRFKRWVRDLDLWCSSCLLATEGDESVGVLLGAKRDDASLVLDLRVHPDHRRCGHARHLLTSLAQKLAILGPPRLVAELPAERSAARALFTACGWREEERLVDWRREPAPSGESSGDTLEGLPMEELPIAPLAVADVLSSGLVPARAGAWHRDPAALARAPEPPAGLGFYSPERLEACVLFREEDDACELLALGAVESGLGRAALGRLVAELARRHPGAPLRLARVAGGELDPELLAGIGFAPAGERARFASEARAA
jgi:GNAT superfamily N-acetyltransferase